MSIEQSPYLFPGSAPDKYPSANSLSLHTSESHSYLKRGLEAIQKDLDVPMGDEEHLAASLSLTTSSLSSSSSTPSMSLSSVTSITSEDGPTGGPFEGDGKDHNHTLVDNDKVSTSTSTTTITELGLGLDQIQLQDTTIEDGDGDGVGVGVGAGAGVGVVLREQEEQEYDFGPSISTSTSTSAVPLQLSSATSSVSSSTTSLPSISNSPPIITTTTTTTITITSASTPNLHDYGSVTSATVTALSNDDSGNTNTNMNATSLRSLLRPRQFSDFTGQRTQQDSLNVKFAPLPELAPRKRKSSTPLGMAAKRQVARRRADPGMFDQEGFYWTQEEFERIRAIQEQKLQLQQNPDFTPEEIAMREEKIKKKEERRREKELAREKMKLEKEEERKKKELEYDPIVAVVKRMGVVSKIMWKKMANKDLKGLSEEEVAEEEKWKKKRKEYKRKQRERHEKTALVARYEIPEKPADEEEGEGRVWIEEVGEPYRKMQEMRAKDSIDTESIILNSEPSSPNPAPITPSAVLE